MTDNELRGFLLQKLYDWRKSGRGILKPDDFQIDFPEVEITRIFEQLYEYGMVDGDMSEGSHLLYAKITAQGVDVIEGTEEPPIGIHVTQDSRTFNISHSTGIQIGDHNTQQIVAAFEKVIEQIDAADAPDEEKKEAKKHLSSFLKHPIVVKVFGELLSWLPGVA